MQADNDCIASDNFLPKQCKEQGCKAKVKKQVGPGTGVEVLEKEENALETAPVVSKRELVDKFSLCCASLRACTVDPQSGTTTTGASQ